MSQTPSPAMDSNRQWILLARILRPQGRKGEVLAELFTDFPERFKEHTRVWLATAGNSDTSTQAAEVISYWLPVGRNAGRIVLQFAGVESIKDAQRLAGKEVVIPISERMPLDSGAAYISDLLGCTVFNRGQAIGTVQDVQFPTTPDGSRRLEDAPPLLAVAHADGGEVLIPFVTAYVVELNPGAKTLRMSLPEGLVDLNREAGTKS